MDLRDKELYVDSIEFSYKSGQQLLTGVYLQCKVGDVVALLGRNGCGKSTLMKIIFGSLKPKHAYIKLNGRPAKTLYTSGEVCYLPQQRFLPTSNYVKDIVKLFIPEKSVRQSIMEDEIISKVKDSKVADLSLGEERYLELLLLIHQKAPFILLDEPFSGVSPYLKERIQERIMALKETKGFIISDHHYHSVLDISTRIILLANGGCRILSSKKDLELFYVPEGTFDENPNFID